MRFLIFAALIGASAAVLESTASTLANSSMLLDTAASAIPDGLADIDLVDLASEGLRKRRAMTYCANENSSSGACKPLDETISGTLATLLKRNANSNTCTGSSGIVDSVAYKFVTAPKGNCRTTAEEATIQGGLNRYFDYLGNQICGVHSVRLDHGGTYRAYITLGPVDANLNSVACSSSGTYVDCGNGGSNDA